MTDQHFHYERIILKRIINIQETKPRGDMASLKANMQHHSTSSVAKDLKSKVLSSNNVFVFT